MREVPHPPHPRDPDQPELVKAVVELASENADLYKQVGELTNALKTEKARFATWAERVASDREAVSTPEGWRHGDAVIEPAPITVDALNNQDPSGNMLDWYYRLRKL